MKKNTITVPIFFFVLLVLLVACSPAPAAPAELAEGGDNQESAAPEEGADVAAGGDLVVPNICELLPADEVALLAGGTLASEPNASDDGESFKGCWYDLTLSDGSYDYYIVYVEPASFLAIFDDSAEVVADLGDRAQLKWEEDESQYRLAVIEGNVGVEINGKRSDVMIELARLILERL